MKDFLRLCLNFRKTTWMRKQELAFPSRYYGGMGTIHGTNVLDIMVDDKGVVKAVWFRCQQLPFEVAEARAWDGDDTGTLPLITGVEVQDR